MAGKALTVRGPIEPADLGFTSMHEHILVDVAKCYRERFQKALPGNAQFPDGPFTLVNRSKRGVRSFPIHLTVMLRTAVVLRKCG
ncbi:MAG TPA: hypothetical protein VJL07_00570 [Dehalococcoidia bacterium]|nr:hypothetical protein [Dehalococcoidia bacterium]